MSQPADIDRQRAFVLWLMARERAPRRCVRARRLRAPTWPGALFTDYCATRACLEAIETTERRIVAGETRERSAPALTSDRGTGDQPSCRGAPETVRCRHGRRHARTRELAKLAGESRIRRRAAGCARAGARWRGIAGAVRCGIEGCGRPAHRLDERFERPLCRRHLCEAIEAWRDANRAAGRCWRCGADKADSPYRDCDGCRRVNVESCRRYRARRARLRDKHKARDEWRATAATDERARWLRGARLRWLGKVVGAESCGAGALSRGARARSFSAERRIHTPLLLARTWLLSDKYSDDRGELATLYATFRRMRGPNGTRFGG